MAHNHVRALTRLYMHTSVSIYFLLLLLITALYTLYVSRLNAPIIGIFTRPYRYGEAYHLFSANNYLGLVGKCLMKYV